MNERSARKRLLSALSHLNDEDTAMVQKAIDMANRAHEGQKRDSGEPYIVHPYAVAEILATWKAPADVIAAGCLHDTLEDTDLTYAEIYQTFAEEVAILVDGVTKFNKADFADSQSMDNKIETLRKLFEVMRSDIRVAIVKLADRLHNMRTVSDLSPERQHRFATETMNVYYRIARHLGMNDMRRELSDLCMPILHPEASTKLLLQQEAQQTEFHNIHKGMVETIETQDKDQALVELRMEAHSLHTMWQHQQAGRNDEPPFVLLAIARDHDACYDLLKIIHTLYRPISSRFHDYIASPRENAYQTIRTTVVSNTGQLLSVRIRTKRMDEQEQRGILLKCFEEHGDVPGFSWLERSEHLDKATRESSEAFWEALQTDIFQRNIQININGEEISVPQGSSVLDAAYIHFGTEANRTHNVMVNGVPTHIGHRLEDEDVIATKLDAYEHIEYEWLQCVDTTYARSIIVDSLRERSQHEKLHIGQQLLQKELDRYKKGLIGEISRHKRQAVTEHFRRHSFDEVVAMIGEGVLRPSEVVFQLYPEKRRFFWQKRDLTLHPYDFAVRVIGDWQRRQTAQPAVHALAKTYDTTITQTKLQPEGKDDTFQLDIHGQSDSRLHFADFVSALERQEEISSVRVLLLPREFLTVLSMFTIALATIFFAVHLLDAVQQLTNRALLSTVLPLIPIFLANHIFLRTLQHYIINLRSERWLIGSGFLLNIFGMLLVLWYSNTQYILPMVAAFVVSIVYLGYRLIRSESMFQPHQTLAYKRISTQEWSKLRKQKLVGYIIRIAAVTIWGILPLYLRYTPITDLSLGLKMMTISLGALITTFIFMLSKKIFVHRWTWDASLPRNGYFYMMTVGNAAWVLFASLSLQLTTSTNFLLLQNFGPVLTLVVALIFWRKQIQYLQQANHMALIFFTFILGSTGSSLIIYNSIQSAVVGSLQGDLLGLITMIADAMLVIGQIRYLSLLPRASGYMINVMVFGGITIMCLPIVLMLYGMNLIPTATDTLLLSLYGFGAGAILGIGQLLNYEAFRRIDGFIAFLMFNISILITFGVEVIWFNTFTPTNILLLGGAIIIGSSIMAEKINTHCQKQCIED